MICVFVYLNNYVLCDKNFNFDVLASPVPVLSRKNGTDIILFGCCCFLFFKKVRIICDMHLGKTFLSLLVDLFTGCSHNAKYFGCKSSSHRHISFEKCDAFIHISMHAFTESFASLNVTLMGSYPPKQAA